MAENSVALSFVEFRTSGVRYPFAIEPASYVKRDLIDFAPRAGGGDVAYSNLDLYQIVTQDSWHHGLGFVQFRDKFGYRHQATRVFGQTSDIDARHVGMAMLWTHRVNEFGEGASNTNSINNFIGTVDFNGSTYFYTYDGIWRRTQDGAYSQVLTNFYTSDLISNGQYLLAASRSGRLKVSRDGTTWTDGGVSGNPPTGYLKMAVHNGFIWGAESKPVSFSSISGTFANYNGGGIVFLIISRTYTINVTSGSFLSQVKAGDEIYVRSSGKSPVFEVKYVVSNNQLVGKLIYFLSGGATGLLAWSPDNSYLALHFFANADASDAEGSGTADPDAIMVGVGGYTCRGLASFNGAIHIAKDDGVWAVDDTVVPPVARRVLDFSDEFDASNFSVFTPWRGRLYFNIKNVLYAYNGASLSNVTPPTYSLDFPPASFGQYINAVYRGPWLYVACRENATSDVLLAFDGTGWFKMSDCDGLSAVGYSALTDKLFFGMYLLGTVNSIQLRNESDLPYANFAVDIEAYLSLSELDFGFRRVKKSFAEIDVEVYNVTTGRYVAVDYSADGGAWHRLGYTAQSGVTELVMNPTVEANKLDVRLVMRTGDATQSPVLRNFTLKAMVRPNVLYGHQFMVKGADFIQMLDGTQHSLSSEEQKIVLETLRDTAAPFEFVDPFGISHQVYISTCTFRNIVRRPGEKRSNWDCIINCVEVR